MLKIHSEIPSTKLGDLVEIKAAKSLQAMLPSALNDNLLLSLAKDLRLLERMNSGDKTQETNLAPPLYLVLELLMRGDDYRGQSSGLDIPDQAIDKALGLLHVALEREIVGRVLGVRVEDVDKQFLAGLDSCISLKSSEFASC
jgi:hypothetical protein